VVPTMEPFVSGILEQVPVLSEKLLIYQTQYPTKSKSLNPSPN